uniref:Rad60/SUMO-like domain-containing protein n=1 Tax=Cyprinus carpio TaxID=7962 RepID=A0A8C1TK77_CYPCA
KKKKKPGYEGVRTENAHINLKVAGQEGSVIQFKIKRHTPLNKLMKAYWYTINEMPNEHTIINLCFHRK